VSSSTYPTPLVSIVVASRDRPRLAARAIASIASQRFEDFEVIIVDDGSRETALAEYRQLCADHGPRFRLDTSVPSGSPGSGPAAVRNRGIRAARGQYVAFLDDDDEWTREDHLAVAVEALRGTGLSFYFADMQGVRGEKVQIVTWYPEPPEQGGALVGDLARVFRLPRRLLIRVFRSHMIHPDCWVIERETLLKLNGFNERLRFVEDLELGLRIVDAVPEVVYRAEPVVRYRLPEDDAESLKYDKLTILLQYSLAAQTLRCVCRNPGVRRCARARESWTLMQMSAELASRRQYGAAVSFGWQSLFTFPTAGSCYSFLLVLVKSALRGAWGQGIDRPLNAGR
jgi:glycosyltransferase involved in cell wall biosynthesis